MIGMAPQRGSVVVMRGSGGIVPDGGSGGGSSAR